MSVDEGKGSQPLEEAGAKPPSNSIVLRQLGRFAAITPPAVTLLLSALSKPVAFTTSNTPISSRQFKEPVGVAALRQAA